MKIKNASAYSTIVLILALVFEIVPPCCAQAVPDEKQTGNYISQVYLTEEQALREVFPHCDEIVFNVIPLTKEEKSQLQNKLKRKIYEDFFVVYMGMKSGEVTGYAIITEEIGKFHPYTFVVSVDLKGKIDKIAVLVYRESRGSEIAKKRFLYQFKGKSLKNKIRINKDIINISGATMSVVTMCKGVKKVLTVIDEFYLSGKSADKIASLEKIKYGNEDGTGQKQKLKLFKKAALSMGTVFELTIYAADKYIAEKTFNDVFQETNRLDYLMSNYKKESVLSELNKDAHTGPAECNKELADVIEQSLQYSEITDGAFDITIGPLMKKWGFFKKEGRIPDKEELASLLESVSYKNIIIEEKTIKSLLKDPITVKTVHFKNADTQIDLGGIGKGYAVDMAAKVLKQNGINSALINFAGNIYTFGTPPGKDSWVIGLQHPRESEGLLGTFEIKDKAVSTSGDYEKFFTVEGKRYSHIIDPRTGKPVEGIVSVTIVTDNATRADALSTGVFVLGLEKGMALIEKLPDVEGIIIYEDVDSKLSTKTSSGMQDLFKENTEDSQNEIQPDMIMSGS
ncbi:MAG: FAD:protein FMN transferase [Candidatus Scalindua rubra]|uniref:FAD:protein FMN transferase n=1 Tax=Candidatus Scalindua brodae TaxID=237368 RepID=A0A0B0EHS3_9BACT|nr:MAG: lipoprotein [Candidatus Scalindua brodae]MBZ0109528.1 FAD:protein FMN transferase [Candidatus Scalindua rubra]TWU33462.1 Thiamine biosynthesis lipoprotein ApbE precursor [Candidatus Brocadiaceae bacterium S225]